MNALDTLRNDLIERILTINNKSYLSALSKILENSELNSKSISLTEEQKLMLALSDADIKNKKTISQAELNKADLKWLKEL
ncbi:MAG: hypothetical protein IPP29_07730 [Bacteroidetes bacterium]|nr:hypothetical protein [Bacteroidota bacterium]